MERDAIMEERPLTAAIAAALLGQQGSAVWTRTAELLLLSSQETRRHFNRARLELEDVLGDATPQGWAWAARRSVVWGNAARQVHSATTADALGSRCEPARSSPMTESWLRYSSAAPEEPTFPADALAGWPLAGASALTHRQQRPRHGTQARQRRACRLSSAGHPAGWLVERDVADGVLAHAEDFLTQIFGDMRLLGSDPPCSSRPARRPPVATRRRAFVCHRYPVR
jgi:hypothetical protein